MLQGTRALVAICALAAAACEDSGGRLGAPGELDVHRGDNGGEGKTGSVCAMGDADCASGYWCVGGRCVWLGGEDGEGAGEAPRPPADGGDRVTFPAVPVPGERYVFVSVPGSRSLARIRLGGSLSVDSVDLDAEAKAVATLPGRDLAVVLTGDKEGRVVDATGEGEPAVHTVPLQPALTHLTASPTLPYVIAWSDRDEAGAAGNEAEVSVVDLSPLLAGAGGKPRAYDLSVGENPRDVVFSEDGRRAAVVTDQGVSVLPPLETLEEDGRAPPVRVHEEAFSDPTGRRVVLTPDLRWALVVQPGEARLRLADLAAGRTPEPLRLELGHEPTDLALLPGGARALVVLAAGAQAALIDVPGDFEAGTAGSVFPLAEQVVDRAEVSQDGSFALLYSAGRADNVLVKVDLREGVADRERARPIRLGGPVRAVAVSPSGRAAVAFHPSPASEGAPAFSLLSFEPRLFAKPFATRGAPAGAFVFVPPELGVEQALVALDDRGRGIREVLSVPVDSFIGEPVMLRAPPVALGLVPTAGLAFVTQDDPEGLITFVGLDGDASPRDVSRFRRNRRID